MYLADYAILYSKAGGARQSLHTDYTIHDTHPRFSGIIAVNEGTKLLIEDGENSGQEKEIKLNIGEAIIMRGNFKHAGASYTKNNNRRIFFKAIPVGEKLLKEEIDSVGYLYCCEGERGGCRKMLPTKSIKRNHRYYCEAVHGKEIVTSRREKAKVRSSRKRKKEKMIEDTINDDMGFI